LDVGNGMLLAGVKEDFEALEFAKEKENGEGRRDKKKEWEKAFRIP
jgi:hypothetical protein